MTPSIMRDWNTYQAKQASAKDKQWPTISERYIAGWGKTAMNPENRYNK